MKMHHGVYACFGPGSRRRSRGWRARAWLWENPSPEELVELLEEYQRDLEEEAAHVADRIRDLKESQGG